MVGYANKGERPTRQGSGVWACGSPLSVRAQVSWPPGSYRRSRPGPPDEIVFALLTSRPGGRGKRTWGMGFSFDRLQRNEYQNRERNKPFLFPILILIRFPFPSSVTPRASERALIRLQQRRWRRNVSAFPILSLLRIFPLPPSAPPAATSASASLFSFSALCIPLPSFTGTFSAAAFQPGGRRNGFSKNTGRSFELSLLRMGQHGRGLGVNVNALE